MTVCVYGAGSIGCTLGGRLAAAGVPVALVGRPRIAAEVAEHGLVITDLAGGEWRAEPGAVPVLTEPGAPPGAGLVLVTVKSAATAGAGAELARTLASDAVVISFQNGLDNVDVLRAALPGRTVLAGMVPFNVVHRGDGRFHIATSGGLEVQADPALGPYREGFRRAGLELREHRDLRPVQWAKLLLNLNNAINALSGLPLQAELSDRRFRRCPAQQPHRTRCSPGSPVP
jgi:2-dehydropantoate 2-reductase